MIRTILATTASVAALALAAPAAAQDLHEGHADGEVEWLLQSDDSGESQTPTMSFGEWGVDPSLLSANVDPGDDFFAYVNQKWLDANPLPPEFSRFGAFNLLREKSTTDVKSLVDALVALVPDAPHEIEILLFVMRLGHALPPFLKVGPP